jgi:hypothetical protein
MIGRAEMEIKEVMIERMNGAQMRAIGAGLMSATNEDSYLVFIQKVDAGVKPLPYHAVKVMFEE